jgi:Na+-translocating ferredoxin:NAD+ oxidoreductase subunit G
MAKKKLESTFINMVVVLCGVTIVSAAVLGYVFDLTKDRIAAALEAKKLKAIKEVIIEGYDNSPATEMFTIKSEDGTDLECYPAKLGDKTTSVAIKSYTKIAFSGEIWLMVGLLDDGSINKISVVSQKETPGLGTKIDAAKYKAQYYGKNPATYNLKVKKDGGEIDAITAATISSRAFSDAVDRAYKAYMNYKRN